LERRVCVLYVHVWLMCVWKAYFFVSVCDACVRERGFLVCTRMLTYADVAYVSIRQHTSAASMLFGVYTCYVFGQFLFSRHVPVCVCVCVFVSVFSLCGCVVLCAHFFLFGVKYV
jgi:hypothetical protein